ncbi:hypothetical protein OJ253_1576 [Cryptosporidium canis]|uniref:Uncharacterized protein n=1 Tax=Cryptosporidium canis TaxID=195482 RepID=A0A9D5DH96_9CRYT|nr:hypothetical protein OJ253_1576 [Cryptosporidium canis]
MGNEHSKTNDSEETASKIENNKGKIKSNHSIAIKNTVRKNLSTRKNSSSESEEYSDNESFSLIVKHKTQNSSIKKGPPQSINFKNGNIDLDWDSIIKVIDTDVMEGMVIIEDLTD